MKDEILSLKFGAIHKRSKLNYNPRERVHKHVTSNWKISEENDKITCKKETTLLTKTQKSIIVRYICYVRYR